MNNKKSLLTLEEKVSVIVVTSLFGLFYLCAYEGNKINHYDNDYKKPIINTNYDRYKNK